MRVRERSGGSKWARGARYALAQRFSEPQSVLRPVGELTRPQRHALLLGALRPLATVLAKRFGFQTTHAVPGAAGEAIPSNLANQLEHVAALLANRMDAEPQRSFEHSLQAAAESLHNKVLANYIGWVAHVGLPSVVREPRRGDSDLITLASTDVSIWGFLSAEEGAVWLLNARLNRILLYFLIWGEAANLRHAPECLCFLFYCAASSLLLPDTSSGDGRDPRPEPPPVAWVAGGNEATLKASASLTAPGVSSGGRRRRPRARAAGCAAGALSEVGGDAAHRYLHFHVLTSAGDHIATRVMYDDLNECFWLRGQLVLLSPDLHPVRLRPARAARHAGLVRCAVPRARRQRTRRRPWASARQREGRAGEQDARLTVSRGCARDAAHRRRAGLLR